MIFCRGILFDTEESKDIVQEVFLELWNNDKKTIINNSIKTYLYACVKYKAFNRIKKLNIIDKHKEQLIESYLSANEYNEISEKSIQKDIRKFIKTLPPQMQKVLEYHSIYGWKKQDIANELGISINTVKTHIKRAYQKIRDNFSNNYLFIYLLFTFLN